MELHKGQPRLLVAGTFPRTPNTPSFKEYASNYKRFLLWFKEYSFNYHRVPYMVLRNVPSSRVLESLGSRSRGLRVRCVGPPSLNP